MKRLIIFAFMLTMGFICKAQYNPYYNPYTLAAIAAETDETYKLNNIRFDEKAIKQNPEAWAAYQDYLRLNNEYIKKSKTYETVAWVGLGTMGVSFIPMSVSAFCDMSDTAEDATFGLGVGLLCAGGIAGFVGLIGALNQSGKIKINKKDFIYYLKTTNNGIGIVTIF